MSLEVRSLRFSYGGCEVLHGIDLDVGKGITAVLGPNGAGKSSFVKCLAGVQRPSGGTAVFDGLDLLSPRRDDGPSVAYLAQGLPEISGASVLELMILGRVGSLALKVSDEDIDRSYGALETLGIEALAERDFAELSGGQRQMVMIAQCLVSDPDLLILDEPMNNLDLRKELDMFDAIGRIAGERGMTVLMVLHDVNFASRFADSICVLKNGRVHSRGTPEEVVTEEMLREVYGVESILSRDSFGNPRIEAVRATGDIIRDRIEEAQRWTEEGAVCPA